MPGHPFCIKLRYIDHQLPAAGTAGSTIDLRRNFIVQPVYYVVDLIPIFPAQPFPERTVFFFPFFCELGNTFSICFRMVDNANFVNKVTFNNINIHYGALSS